MRKLALLLVLSLTTGLLPAAPELSGLDAYKRRLKSDNLGSQKNCIMAVRSFFSLATYDYMVTISKFREENTSNIYYLMEISARRITEHGEGEPIKNDRKLRAGEADELFQLLGDREIFNLPQTQKQKNKDVSRFVFGELWSDESKSTKIIARDVYESRVMDDFIRIMYLLGETVSLK